MPYQGENVIEFQYRIQQCSVQYSNRSESLFAFVVNLAAILGGVFAVAKMTDACIYGTSKAVFKSRINKII